MSEPPNGKRQESEAPKQGAVADVLDNLGAIFRYMLPGGLIVGTARITHPSWFDGFDSTAWQHLAIVTTIAVVAGNAWFSINRYFVHQVVDFVCYLVRSEGPARTRRSRYFDDLALWVREALTADVSLRARQHVAFRASSVLLIYTLSELLLLAALWSEPSTIAHGRETALVVAAAILFSVGVWQNVITRRIDAAVLHEDRVK